MASFDWQAVIAIACVALAAAWWVRRAVKWAASDGSCASGCGKCASKTPTAEGSAFVPLDHVRASVAAAKRDNAREA